MSFPSTLPSTTAALSLSQLSCQSASSTLSVATLLIVDDTPDNLRLLGQLLAHGGYHVRKSLSGAIALQSARLEPPDLILLDILMPDMDGYAVCQALKEDPATAQVPVIFISALDQITDKTRAFDYGGVDYITKPFEGAEVLARVNNQITIRQQQLLLEAHNRQLQIEIEHRQRIEARLQRQLVQEKLIADITEQIHAAPALTPLLQSITVNLQTHLQTDRVLVYLAQGDGNLQLQAEACREAVVSAAPWVAPWPLAQQPQSQLLERSRFDPSDPCYVYLTGLGVETAWVVPIYNEQTQFWGVLMVHHCGQGAVGSHQTLPLLQHVARQLGIAARQHSLLTQLQAANAQLLSQSRTDPLTRLGNRRYFDEYMQQVWQSQAAYQELAPTLLLVDIDFFKAYNDTYGHPAGDRCLTQVAQALKQAVQRPRDRVFRYGGEEFALVLPCTSLLGAATVVERIQQALEIQAIPHATSPIGAHVTVSIGGVGQSNPHLGAIADYVQLADQALYQAKATGRNQAKFLIADGDGLGLNPTP